MVFHSTLKQMLKPNKTQRCRPCIPAGFGAGPQGGLGEAVANPMICSDRCLQDSTPQRNPPGEDITTVVLRSCVNKLLKKWQVAIQFHDFYRDNRRLADLLLTFLFLSMDLLIPFY